MTLGESVAGDESIVILVQRILTFVMHREISLGCLVLVSCSGCDAPQSCIVGGSLVNFCFEETHFGVRLGSSSNSLATQPSEIVVLVADSGEIRVLGTLGMDIVGFIHATSTQGEVSGSVTAFAQSGFSFSNGLTVDTGTITGSTDPLSLDVVWTLASGDSGQLSSRNALRSFSGVEVSEVAGTWVKLDENGLTTISYTVDDQGGIAGQDTFGCVFDGDLETTDSTILNIQLSVSLCGQLDGRYLGLGSYERAGNDDADSPEVDTIRIHINRPDRVITERWVRT